MRIADKEAQEFRGHLAPALRQPYDPSFRQFLLSAGAAVTLVGLSKVIPQNKQNQMKLSTIPACLPSGRKPVKAR